MAQPPTPSLLLSCRTRKRLPHMTGSIAPSWFLKEQSLPPNGYS